MLLLFQFFSNALVVVIVYGLLHVAMESGDTYYVILLQALHHKLRSSTANAKFICLQQHQHQHKHVLHYTHAPTQLHWIVASPGEYRQRRGQLLQWQKKMNFNQISYCFSRFALETHLIDLMEQTHTHTHTAERVCWPCKAL